MYKIKDPQAKKAPPQCGLAVDRGGACACGGGHSARRGGDYIADLARYLVPFPLGKREAKLKAEPTQPVAGA